MLKYLLVSKKNMAHFLIIFGTLQIIKLSKILPEAFKLTATYLIKLVLIYIKEACASSEP